MAHVLIVGVSNTLGFRMCESFAKHCTKLAVISREKIDRSEAKKLTKESKATVQTFTTKFNRRENWVQILSEVKDFLGGKLNVLLYLDGIYATNEFTSAQPATARLLMQMNYTEPLMCITAALPLIKKSNGSISVLGRTSAGRGRPGTCLYTSSKKALEYSVRSISKQHGIVSSIIYSGITDSFTICRSGKPVQSDQQKVDSSVIKRIRSGISEEMPEIILAERKAAYGGPIVIVPDPQPFGAANVNVPDLSKAILEDKLNDLKEILRFFKRNPDMLFETDSLDRNVFHYVAAFGNIPAFDLLAAKLRKKSFLNEGDKFKWTPVHYAARFGHLRMMKRLIREGGDPNCLTNYHCSPLHYLARLEPPAESKHIATYLHTLKVAIDVGADVNQRNFEWVTPVHEAAAAGAATALEFLLKNEGDPHRKTKARQTPLSYAIRSGSMKVVKLLLEAGADPQVCFEFAPEEYHSLMEHYRDTNCRPESDCDDTKREIVVIRTMEDFPPSAQKAINSSGLLNNQKLIDEHWDIFLYVLRFVTRKIYRTPAEFAENPVEAKREFKSRASHYTSIEKATEDLVTNGNPRKMFKIMEDVGRGGFGSVVRVKRLEDKRQVAIKKVSHLTEKEQWNNIDEIYFLTKCEHPCIVKYYNSYIARDEMWMIMEFLEGGSLSQAVSKFHLQEPQICYVTKEILRGLVEIHKRNFAHRDLKSANIMMSVQGDIKIIDFGLCVEVGATETTNMVGSPFWIPPEMIQRKEHGTPADIWSLAILCLEMAMGKPPNRRSALKAMFYVGAGIIPKLMDTDHVTWSAEFRDFLSRMLRIEPSERETAEQLLKHPWIATADTRNGMADIIHHIFVEQSLAKSLGIE